jgi:hypothetical protein
MSVNGLVSGPYENMLTFEECYLLGYNAVWSVESQVVDIQRTTQRYIPEDRTLHNHRCENLKSYMLTFPKICSHGCDYEDYGLLGCGM